MTGNRANDLISRLFREPGLLDQLHSDKEALFKAWGLTEEERQALREGSFGALERIGVHPILRMHYQMAANPAIVEHVSIRAYLPAIEKEKRHG